MQVSLQGSSLHDIQRYSVAAMECGPESSEAFRLCHTCRMQYLTLASYLANGLCPDKESESRELEYSLLFSVKDSDYIYRESSRVLNTQRSVESCFCIEGEREPESRSFTFEDEKVCMHPIVGNVHAIDQA